MSLNIGSLSDSSRPHEPNLSESVTLRSQLSHELKLRQNCQDLLNLYKGTQDWAAVSQVAQSLITNSQRVAHLKEQLQHHQQEGGLRPFLQSITEDPRSRSLSPEPVEGVKVTEQETLPFAEVVPDSEKSSQVSLTSPTHQTQGEKVEDTYISAEEELLEDDSSDQVTSTTIDVYESNDLNSVSIESYVVEPSTECASGIADETGNQRAEEVSDPEGEVQTSLNTSEVETSEVESCDQLPAETENERKFTCSEEAVFAREQFEDLELKEKNNNRREEPQGVFETPGVSGCIDDEQLNQQTSDNLDVESYNTEPSDKIQCEQLVVEVKNELEEENRNSVSISESLEVESSQSGPLLLPCDNPVSESCANITIKVDAASSGTDIVLSTPADIVDSTTTTYTSSSLLKTSHIALKTTTAASSSTCDYSGSETSSEQFFSPPESINLETDSDLFSDTFDKIELDVYQLVSQLDSVEENPEITVVEEEKRFPITEEVHSESPPITQESFKDNHLEEKEFTEEVHSESPPITRESFKNNHLEEKEFTEEVHSESPPITRESFKDNRLEEKELANVDFIPTCTMYTVHKDTNESGQSQYIVKVSSDKAVSESNTVSHSLKDFLELWSELQWLLSESDSVTTLNKLNIIESNSVPNPGDKNSVSENGQPGSAECDVTALGRFLNQVASDPVLQSEPSFLHFVGFSLPVINGDVGGTDRGSSSEMNMIDDPQIKNEPSPVQYTLVNTGEEVISKNQKNVPSQPEQLTEANPTEPLAETEPTEPPSDSANQVVETLELISKYFDLEMPLAVETRESVLAGTDNNVTKIGATTTTSSYVADEKPQEGNVVMTNQIENEATEPSSKQPDSYPVSESSKDPPVDNEHSTSNGAIPQEGNTDKGQDTTRLGQTPEESNQVQTSETSLFLYAFDKSSKIEARSTTPSPVTSLPEQEETESDVKSSSEEGELQRSESNPILSSSPQPEDTLHMSLMPSNYKHEQMSTLEKSDSVVTRPTRPVKRVKSLSRISTTIRKKSSKLARTISQKSGTMNLGGKKRANESESEESTVKPLSPITGTEWDPTCLLEELYSDYRQGALNASKSGESARHFGYLSKLPMNKTKETIGKKYKRRYFRAQEGKLYYYEDRRVDKALGFVRLETSRVVPMPDKLQIQIIAKDGKSLMLKASDLDDMNTWQRQLLLEAAHPTQLTPDSPLIHKNVGVVIIDIGAASVRAGFASKDAYPELFFPAVASLDATNQEDLGCGITALQPENRYGALQVYPRKVSRRMDQRDFNMQLRALDCIISSVVMMLDVDPQSTQLVLTLPPTVPEKDRNDLLEFLFETLMFSGVCIQEQAVLALYSYNTTSGLVVDIGDHIDIVPIVDGYVIDAGVTRLPFGGNAITESLSKLITSNGIRYFSEMEMYIVRLIKENLCYVSEDFKEDCQKCESNHLPYINAVDVDRFQLPDHRKVFTLDSSRFKAAEGLFDPGLWGKDVVGLQDHVWKAIQACAIDQRRELAKNIYLSGATTLLPGLQERLQKEVATLAGSAITVEVHAGPSRQHAAYLGASVLASLGTFEKVNVVSQEEWSSNGVNAFKKWTGG